MKGYEVRIIYKNTFQICTKKGYISITFYLKNFNRLYILYYNCFSFLLRLLFSNLLLRS